MGKFQNLTGQVFHGTVKALKIVKRDKHGAIIWLWECLYNGPNCKKFFESRARDVKRGSTKSCGCLQRERAKEANTTHGMRKSPEYKIWCGIKQRCNDPNHQFYHLYGGRGIKVCERWENSFEKFYQDMGPRPSKDHELERFDNDDMYSPDNCIWLKDTHQAWNRRFNKIQSLEETNHIRDVYFNHNWSIKNIAEFFRCSVHIIYRIINNVLWKN